MFRSHLSSFHSPPSFPLCLCAPDMCWEAMITKAQFVYKHVMSIVLNPGLILAENNATQYRQTFIHSHSLNLCC